MKRKKIQSFHAEPARKGRHIQIEKEFGEIFSYLSGCTPTFNGRENLVPR